LLVHVSNDWLLHQGEDIVPIPGTKRRKYLEENLGAASMKLSPEELRKIASFLHSHTIAGQRYAASDLARVNGSRLFTRKQSGTFSCVALHRRDQPRPVSALLSPARNTALYPAAAVRRHRH
jgi:hypothetical protein